MMSCTSAESEKERSISDEDDNFVWQDYLELTSTEEVSNICFAHVEQSLRSGFQEGMMMEVPEKNEPHSYWPAIIKMSCGPLLSLCYISPGRTSEFWCNFGTNKVDVKPLGWCQEQQEQNLSTPVCLKPPDSLLHEYPDLDWQQFAANFVLGKPSVPAELLTVDGYTAIERIKQGMQLEVQDEKNPLHHWVATIIENVGGRLLLRYDTPDLHLSDFWLFYTSPRLFRLGWAQKQGSPWRYRPPSMTKLSYVQEQWDAILLRALLEAEMLAPPPDLFQDVVEIVTHGLEVGMKLEAVHPKNKVEICPATVSKLFETGHFIVIIDCCDQLDDDENELSWLCKPGDPFLFPAGWCRKNYLSLTHPRGWTSKKLEFDWEEYLLHTKSTPVPDPFFKKFESALDKGFDVGFKLEAVNPENQHQICAASISKVVGHLLWIHLDSEDSFQPAHLVDADSAEIFPVGWCGSNSYPLKPPRNYHLVCKASTEEDMKSEPSAQQQEGSNQKSSWCPKIYFNHKCFTGPFLSKGKLAQLPKAVGPGPVTLVLREVLSMLISVAYKSRQVLKELQLEGPLPPNMHLEVLKAKLTSTVYRANVGIVTSADKVPAFCQDVCMKLQSCPNLFGPELFTDSCPVGCSALSKSRFTSYWSKHKSSRNQQVQASASDIIKPRRRGRKKLLTRTKTHSTIHAEDKAKRDFKLEEENEDPESEEGETPSRPNSAAGDIISKRKMYKKKLFPQFEMRTRGTKLPNFALKMANWTWGKGNYVPAKKQRRLSSETTNVSQSSQETKNRTSIHGPCSSKHVKTKKKMLDKNPIFWSVIDVSDYLLRTPDCGELAARLAEEDIDGHAFMLLNLPTLQQNLYLQLGPAIKLCQHIERVKFAYLSDYCITKLHCE